MKEQFIITRQGKQYVLFAGLLDKAHSNGLHAIDTELLQIPTTHNSSVAVVKAVVEMNDAVTGEVRSFSGIGDACPDNVGRSVALHLIRMAETRAKARALRDAVNVEVSALEETSGGDAQPTNANQSTSHGPNETPRAQGNSASVHSLSNRQPAPQDGSTPHKPAHHNSSAITAAQSRAATSDPTRKASKSQIDFVKTLAGEWAGEGGVERLESHIGKPLPELTREEAQQWLDRLTPADPATEAAE